MLTTGKTSEENLIPLNMKGSSARSGKLRILFKRMLTDVGTNIDANSRMAGRNKNIIRTTIKCMLVGKVSPARSITVLISTQIKIKGMQSAPFSNFSLETEAAPRADPTTRSINCINQFF
jgi:hypothetical protein